MLLRNNKESFKKGDEVGSETTHSRNTGSGAEITETNENTKTSA